MTAEEKIWRFLSAWLGNAYGAAGLMGNLFAESGLNPKNLQNSYEKKLGFTDEGYTAAVDNGSYANFIKDAAGYGLAQWTYWSRKKNLLQFAKEQMASIGDLEMQLGFLAKEMAASYGSVLAALKGAASVRAASDVVLLQFEKPADQSEAIKIKRASYGQGYYDKYAGAAAQAKAEGGNKMAVKIGHASIDENGRAQGGQAGDQTGREVCVRDWYSKPWTAVIRPKDRAAAEKIAKAMEQACANDRIGYDQGQRTTLFAQAQACGWDLSRITAPCETDCSALVAVCVNAAGISVSKDIYTGNEKSALQATGKFEIFTGADYIGASGKLKRGDILLGKGHTAVVLSDGTNAGPAAPAASATGNSSAVKVESAQGFDKSLAGAYTTTTGLNLRAGAGKDKPSLTIMPEGAKVQCYGYYTGVDGVKWLYVTHESLTGFCSSKYLKR